MALCHDERDEGIERALEQGMRAARARLREQRQAERLKQMDEEDSKSKVWRWIILRSYKPGTEMATKNPGLAKWSTGSFKYRTRAAKRARALQEKYPDINFFIMDKYNRDFVFGCFQI